MSFTDTSERDTIMARLRALSPELRQRFGVRSLALFGSLARGEAHPGSDVDVLVEFDRPATLFVMSDLRARLSEALERSVDVGTADGLRQRIKREVLAEALRVA